MEVAAARTEPGPLVAGPPRSARGELGALLRLAVPLVGAGLLQMAIAAIDVVFVARLGPVDLAAATFGVFLFNLLLYAIIGLTGAAAPLIAAELGRRRDAVREVRRSFRMALWVGAVFCLPVMLILFEGAALLRAAGQDPQVGARAGGFMRVLMIGVPLGVAAGIMRTAAAALGRPGWALVVSALALAVDLVGNYALVFGHLGVPRLGLIGSAAASVVALAAMALAYGAILTRDRRLRRYRLFGRWWRSEWRRFRDIVRLGVPIALAWLFEGGLFSGAALLMGLIGVTDVAAHAVALNIASVTFQIPFGIAQAATIRVGMAYGAGDRAWIGRAGRAALALGIGAMAASAATMWIAPRPLVAIYIDPDLPANVAVAALAVRFLAVAAVFQLVDGAQAVAAGCLRGLQDTRVPMIVAALGYWVAGFGSAVALGFATPLAGVGIWWGLAVGLAVVAVLLTARWRGRSRLGLLPPRTFCARVAPRLDAR